MPTNWKEYRKLLKAALEGFLSLDIEDGESVKDYLNWFDYATDELLTSQKEDFKKLLVKLDESELDAGETDYQSFVLGYQRAISDILSELNK